MLQLPCATQYYPIESLTQQKNGRRHALKNRMLKILQLDIESLYDRLYSYLYCFLDLGLYIIVHFLFKVRVLDSLQ